MCLYQAGEGEGGHMRDKHTDSDRIKVYYMYLTYMHLLYSPHIQSSRYQAAGGNSL